MLNNYAFAGGICRPPKLYTKSGKVKFHPKSVNSEETHFDNKFMIYYTMVKSSAVFIHDCSMIPPYPLLFFGGDISMLEDEGQEVIAVDHWIKFQAPKKIAELVKVCVYQCVDLIRGFYTKHLKLYINCDLKSVNPPSVVYHSTLTKECPL